MGACGEAGAPGNEWRAAADFPLPEAVATSYFLTLGGGLSTEGDPEELAAEPGGRGPGTAGQRQQSQWLADPNRPPWLDGSEKENGFSSAFDQSRYESQTDKVLTFSTGVLAQSSSACAHQLQSETC